MPTSGSTQGGTPITISGENFSPVLLQNQIMIGTSFCTITSASDTEIQRINEAASIAKATTGLITPVNTGTDEEPILELAMLGRIVEQATCGP